MNVFQGHFCMCHYYDISTAVIFGIFCLQNVELLPIYLCCIFVDIWTIFNMISVIIWLFLKTLLSNIANKYCSYIQNAAKFVVDIVEVGWRLNLVE